MARNNADRVRALVQSPQCNLNSRLRALATVLADKADWNTGVGYASHATLGEAMGVKPRQIFNLMRKLAHLSAGLLQFSTWTRFKSGEGRISNGYIIRPLQSVAYAPATDCQSISTGLPSIISISGEAPESYSARERSLREPALSAPKNITESNIHSRPEPGALAPAGSRRRRAPKPIPTRAEALEARAWELASLATDLGSLELSEPQRAARYMLAKAERSRPARIAVARLLRVRLGELGSHLESTLATIVEKHSK